MWYEKEYSVSVSHTLDGEDVSQLDVTTEQGLTLLVIWCAQGTSRNASADDLKALAGQNQEKS